MDVDEARSNIALAEVHGRSVPAILFQNLLDCAILDHHLPPHKLAIGQDNSPL
jgi:hypothetical protein